MQRDMFKTLLEWKSQHNRKPLILQGARQVGKTFLLKAFGEKAYEHIAYLSFEQSPQAAAFFKKDLNPQRIISNLAIFLDTSIEPGKTLLILDEIQECPEALTSLKYFQEEANEYHIAAAGSLLGVKLSQKASFPVGKVNFLSLHPFTFGEFLDAVGKNKLRALLDSIEKIEPISEPFHEELLELLKKYFFVGGMPEAVNEYVKTENLNNVRNIQNDILNAYLLDFAKHVPPQQIIKVTNTWESIPSQLAKENKKFAYSHIEKSARGREYEAAIQWLADAWLIKRCFETNKVQLPLDTYSDRKGFKIYLLDVGLLCAMNKISPQAMLSNYHLFEEFKGALSENFVTQELTAIGFDIYYWTSFGKAEVDFILQADSEVYPLEVKSGINVRSRSLSVYIEKNNPKKVFRASLLNLKQDGIICNYPLYLVNKFPKIYNPKFGS